MGKRIELKPNQRSGKLMLLYELPRKKLPCGQFNRTVLCKCDCGALSEVRLLHFSRERITSCGKCNKIPEKLRLTRIHNSWRGMLNRCNSDSYKESQYYKDKGITVCDEWHDFEAFYNWSIKNGYKKHLVIDRIDSDKGYSPDNCRWATIVENANNKSTNKIVTYKGKEKRLMTLIRELGKEDEAKTIYCRVNRGWSAERAIHTKIREGNYRRCPRS